METYQAVFFFLAYSMIGWLAEVVFFLITERRLINRGFLYGPLCPIYGFASLILLFLPAEIKGSVPALFFTTLLIATVLEYLTGAILEKIFNTRWWDYSKNRFNLKGRICLFNSLLFGIMGVLVITFVHPLVSRLIEMIPDEMAQVGSSLLTALLIADIVASLHSALKLSEKLHELTKLLAQNKTAENLTAWLEAHNTTGVYEALKELTSKGDELMGAVKEKLDGFSLSKLSGHRFLKAFPDMRRPGDYSVVSILKEYLSSARKKLGELRPPKVARPPFLQRSHKAPAAADTKKSFASGLSPFKLFWIFFICSIVGYVLETLFCLVTTGTIESRQGLIYGPFSQIYGFGAVFMTLALQKLKGKRDIWVFLGSAMTGGAFEYISSLLQEISLKTSSWDYSAERFSFHGRTSLLYMFFWGVLGIVLIKEILPRLESFIEHIPNKFGVPMTWALILFMVLDLSVSCAAVYRWSERANGLPPSNAVEEELDRRYGDSFLRKIYPNMQILK